MAAGGAALNRIALTLFALTLALLVPAVPLGIGVEPAFDLVAFHLFAVVLATAGGAPATRLRDEVDLNASIADLRAVRARAAAARAPVSVASRFPVTISGRTPSRKESE